MTEPCNARLLLPLPVLQHASSYDKALRSETAATKEEEALPVCTSAESDLQF